jgi:hypothetical protein
MALSGEGKGESVRERTSPHQAPCTRGGGGREKREEREKKKSGDGEKSTVDEVKG